MKEATFAKRWVKLNRAVAVANDDAQRYRAALVVVQGVCRRTCGRCDEGEYPVDIAIRTMKEVPGGKLPGGS
jgi:hypothetical protein